MYKSEAEDSCKAKNKMDVLLVIIVIFLSVISNKRIKCDAICEDLSIDAITQLHNGSIAIFTKNDVWFLNREQNQLEGPCPISRVFKGMTGPVDAALTITRHDMITDFIGASVYFVNKTFYTFKNLGQYQAEWGTIIYIPVKGMQTEIGQADPEASDYMKRTISYAFFDPKDGKCKFVFSDGTSLAYTFDMGVNFDTPVVSTIDDELSKYGVDYVPKTLTAALTLAKDDTSKLYLFEGKTYCPIKLDSKAGSQSCRLKPIKEFFNCQSLSIKNMCTNTEEVVTQSHDEPVEVRNRPTPKQPDQIETDKTVADNKVKIRTDNETKPGNDSKSGTETITSFIFVLISFFAFIF